MGKNVTRPPWRGNRFWRMPRPHMSSVQDSGPEIGPEIDELQLSWFDDLGAAGMKGFDRGADIPSRAHVGPDDFVQRGDFWPSDSHPRISLSPLPGLRFGAMQAPTSNLAVPIRNSTWLAWLQMIWKAGQPACRRNACWNDAIARRARWRPTRCPSPGQLHRDQRSTTRDSARSCPFRTS